MNDNLKEIKKNWLLALGQVVLILLGILLAVGVDSWWEEHQKREDEVGYLRSLRADFVSNQKLLEEEIEFEFKILGYGKDIHANINSDFTLLSKDDFIKKIGDFYWLTGWNGSIGTYDEMIGSGRLLYLQNHSLRILLSNYLKLSAAIDFSIETQNSNYFLTHAPFLQDHLVVSRLGWMTDYKPTLPFEEDMSALRTRKFANLISDWYVTHHDILIYQLEPTLEAGKKIIALIDAELALKAKNFN